MGFEIHESRTLENSFDVLASAVHVFNDIFKKCYVATDLSKFWDNEILKTLLFPYSFAVNLFGVGDVMEFILRKK